MTINEVRQAASRLAGIANRTPVMKSRTLNEISGAEVFLKCENFQRTGSFKFRGAFNAVSQLSEEQKRAGVTAHSSGNHAQGLALAAREAGVRAAIVMPDTSPKVKQAAVRGYGAEVILCESTLDAREEATKKLIEEHGYTMVHSSNDEMIIAGQGTATLELFEEVGKLDYVLSPLGGGGVLSGTAAAARGLMKEVRVWGVEPELVNDAYLSIQAGRIIRPDNADTLADGLKTSLGNHTFAHIHEYVGRIVTVSEQEILEAMRFIWERMKLIVEPSGAVSLIPALRGMFKSEERIPRVGVIITGGNLDLKNFFEIIEKKIK